MSETQPSRPQTQSVQHSPPQPSSLPQYGLALHTTTPLLGLALDNFAGDKNQSVVDLGRSLAAELHLRLADFLQPRQWSDLKLLAVARGPGGFTGARMGLVVARTLAQQLGLPLFSVSTLAARAEQAWSSGLVPCDRTIALSMPAQRGQLFTALYRRVNLAADSAQPPQWVPEALQDDQVTAPEIWQERLNAPTASNSGPAHPSAHSSVHLTIEPGANSDLADSVASLLQIAHRCYLRGDRPSWEQAVPFYGQHPVSPPPASRGIHPSGGAAPTSNLRCPCQNKES